MDVYLYIYDLSHGLAAQLSQQLLGTYIPAVYHTSIVLENVEYYFGAGIQTSTPPGRTHHGAPMEIQKLGTTQLPPDVVAEYLAGSRDVYTAASYDLFLHNCNNFSHDLALFLLGTGIPPHITALPRTVLDSPFGRLLRPELDRAMRGITQAPSATATEPATRMQNGGSASPPSVPQLLAAARNPTKYPTTPPLPKLLAALHPLSANPAVKATTTFLSAPHSAPPPPLAELSAALRTAPATLPPPSLFAAYDLVRALLAADSRAPAFFAAGADGADTLRALLAHVNSLHATAATDAKLTLVALRLAANLAAYAPAAPPLLASEALAQELVNLLAAALAEQPPDPKARAAAAAAAANLAAANMLARLDKGADALDEGLLVELLAAVLDALAREQDREVVLGLVRAVGFLAYGAPAGGELRDLCRAVEAGEVVRAKEGLAGGDALFAEVLEEVLGRELDGA